jgi:hypothetical protein
MNKIKFLLIAAALSLLLFPGCLQVHTTVNLNNDGSGTIEEIVTMKTEVINMMKEFVMAFDSTNSEEFNMFNETELKAKESNYGEGVKYLSGEKIVAYGYEGFKAVYVFEDINKLKLNPSPADKIPFGDEMDEPEEKVAKDILKFNFKKGIPSVLVINFPNPNINNEDSLSTEITADEDSTNGEAIEKLKEMFDGMEIALAINFSNKIDETDASFVDGSKVTLMEIDFSELIKHQDVLEKLQKSKPETMKDFKETIGDLPGIKVEFKDKVTVKFN